ncbi:MAG: thioredoxin family protein, partial [bacterium]|nr:thioredoxin family protein [bacterium]
KSADAGAADKQTAGSSTGGSKTSSAKTPDAKVKPKSDSVSKVQKKLPRLVDLGATKCIPCKMMAPILEEIKAEYKGQLIVEFIDVWENSGAGDKYGINSIPTQVFFDETGKEISRHVGFMPKEDILATFKEHGINLEKGK